MPARVSVDVRERFAYASNRFTAVCVTTGLVGVDSFELGKNEAWQRRPPSSPMCQPTKRSILTMAIREPSTRTNLHPL